MNDLYIDLLLEILDRIEKLIRLEKIEILRKDLENMGAEIIELIAIKRT